GAGAMVGTCYAYVNKLHSVGGTAPWVMNWMLVSAQFLTLREGILHLKYFLNDKRGISSFTTKNKDDMIASSISGAVVGGTIGNMWRGPPAIPAASLMYALIASAGQLGITQWHAYRLNQSLKISQGITEPKHIPWYTKLKNMHRHDPFPDLRQQELDANGGIPRSTQVDPVADAWVWMRDKINEVVELPEWASPVANAFDIEYRKRLNKRLEILELQVLELRERVADLREEERPEQPSIRIGGVYSVEEEWGWERIRERFSGILGGANSAVAGVGAGLGVGPKVEKVVPETKPTLLLSPEEERGFARWRDAFGAFTGMRSTSSSPSTTSTTSPSPSPTSSSTSTPTPSESPSTPNPTDIETDLTILSEADRKIEEKARAKCERWKEKLINNSPVVRFMMEELAKSGCPFDPKHFRCTPCAMDKAGGFAPDYGVILCSSSFLSKQHMEDTMVHELVHAYDHCTTKIDWGSCEHYACSEIRATSLSGDCKFTREVRRGTARFGGHHQTCVKRRTIFALKQLPQCQGEGVAEGAVRTVWDKCFADKAPFDEIY
ncbi:Mitochondrial inner membrane protease atp23, partial [Rhizophlyctis rosea]